MIARAAWIACEPPAPPAFPRWTDVVLLSTAPACTRFLSDFQTLPAVAGRFRQSLYRGLSAAAGRRTHHRHQAALFDVIPNRFRQGHILTWPKFHSEFCRLPTTLEAMIFRHSSGQSFPRPPRAGQAQYAGHHCHHFRKLIP